MHTISPLLHLWKEGGGGSTGGVIESPNEQINKKSKANTKKISQISKKEHATAQRNAKISSPSLYSTVDSHSTHQENYIKKTTTTTAERRQDLLYNPAGFCTLTFISDIYFGMWAVGEGEASLDTVWHPPPWCKSSEHRVHPWLSPVNAELAMWQCTMPLSRTVSHKQVTGQGGGKSQKRTHDPSSALWSGLSKEVALPKATAQAGLGLKCSPGVCQVGCQDHPALH